ncbi:MAG TPA: GTPase HflX, partial [Rhodanobacteraceae bacterium]
MLPYPGNAAAARRGAEFTELARSAGAEVLGSVRARADAPNPRFFIGTGKADEIRDKVKELGADLV